MSMWLGMGAFLSDKRLANTTNPPHQFTLKGDTAGVQAVDGRTINENYVWSFTLKAAGSTVFLPLVTR
ncbi:MAG: hypothetical protein ACOYNY_43850 [Caldilineaceae bacterium]